MPPLQPQHTPPSTAITAAVERILWAQLDLWGAYGTDEITYCQRVLRRRLEEYRRLMGHPGLPHHGEGEDK